MSVRSLACAAVFVPFAAGAAMAQPKAAGAGYPVKPIRVLVPSPPGSGSDVMTLAVTYKLS